MNAKPVIPRAVARRDINDAVDHYAGTAGVRVALQFIGALEDAFRMIGDNPAIGSLRYAHELDLPGLRCRTQRGCPYSIYYLDRASHVDVWRVLHSHRDLPVWLDEPDDL